jgi:hypothetical protein
MDSSSGEAPVKGNQKMSSTVLVCAFSVLLEAEGCLTNDIMYGTQCL